jgi:CheY-like chemotaxis protein
VLIIGLSAGNLPEQIRAMESAGMDDYLAKPFRRTIFSTSWPRGGLAVR